MERSVGVSRRPNRWRLQNGLGERFSSVSHWREGLHSFVAQAASEPLYSYVTAKGIAMASTGNTPFAGTWRGRMGTCRCVEVRCSKWCVRLVS